MALYAFDGTGNEDTGQSQPGQQRSGLLSRL